MYAEERSNKPDKNERVGTILGYDTHQPLTWQSQPFHQKINKNRSKL